jgi:hypothetical protein
MRHFKLAALSLLLGASCAQATIVGFSTAPSTGRTAVNASLATLPDGTQFLLGTFSNPGNISLLGSVAAIQAAGGWSEFVPLAGGSGATEREVISTIAGTFPGKFTGQAANNTAAANAFNNQPLYLMVFNTTSAGTATQIGIFRAPSAVTPWVFPANGGGVGDNVTIDVDDTSVVAIGGVGSVSISPSRFILATMVPEPSAIALLAPALIGLLGYRRMRRHG